jgi:hypothetical protein
VKNVTARESAHLFVVYLLKTDLTLDCFVLWLVLFFFVFFLDLLN